MGDMLQNFMDIWTWFLALNASRFLFIGFVVIFGHYAWKAIRVTVPFLYQVVIQDLLFEIIADNIFSSYRFGNRVRKTIVHLNERAVPYGHHGGTVIHPIEIEALLSDYESRLKKLEAPLSEKVTP